MSGWDLPPLLEAVDEHVGVAGRADEALEPQVMQVSKLAALQRTHLGRDSHTDRWDSSRQAGSNSSRRRREGPRAGIKLDTRSCAGGAWVVVMEGERPCSATDAPAVGWLPALRPSGRWLAAA